MFNLFCTICGLVLLVVVACESQPSLDSKFNNGNYVITKLDSKRGMVIHTSTRFTACSDWGYIIRFPSLEIKTDTHVLSEDGSIKIGAYTDQIMCEFELNKDK